MKIKNFLKKNYYLATPLLIFLSYPTYDFFMLKAFPFFGWIALAPLMIYIRDLESKREVFFVTFLAGLIGNLLTYEWIGYFGAKVPGGFIVVLLFLIPSLTVFFALKIFLAEMLSRSFENFRILIFPSVWIIVEWIQSIGFIAYPLPFWGYTQYTFLPFIQSASVIGIMGITFILIVSNRLVSDLVYYFLKTERAYREIFRMPQFVRLAVFAAFAAAICVAGAATMYGHTAKKKDLRIALVQSCISPWEDWQANRFVYLDELKRYTELALAESPDFVIWSESATLETISYDYERGVLNEFERDVLDFVRKFNRPLLTGEIGVTEDVQGYFVRKLPLNNAVLIDPNGKVLNTYSKINLVPFGEWFPYERWLPFVKKIVDEFGGSSFVPGDKRVIFDVLDKKFAVLICYEGIFHRLCRAFRTRGAEFYVNITNDGWTHTYRGHMQHYSVAAIRAVENGIWYIRAGNTGYTAFIDPYGRVTSSIPILDKGYLVSDVDLGLNRETFYTRFGDLVLYAAMLFIGFLGADLAVSGVRKWKTKS